MPDTLTELKPLIAATLLVLLWTLEGVYPMFTHRGPRTPRFLGNVALGVVNGLCMALLFGGALLAATEFARAHGFGLLHWLPLPGYATWLAAFLLIDLWQYLWHRLNHAAPLLWRFHAVHHSDAEMDASTALRFHTGELLASGLARLLVLPLLGVTLPQLALYELVLLPVILFHHANLHIPAKLDRVLRAVMVTPWMHWVHHSDQQPETDSNFSSILSCWDRLFGTFRLRARPETIQLGLDGFRDEEWRPLLALLRIPFTHNFRRRD